MRGALLPFALLGLLLGRAEAQIVETLPSEPVLQVKIMARETHGLIYLLESLRGEPHHSRHLAREFWARHPRTPEDGRALASFQRLMDSQAWLRVSLPGDGVRRRHLADALEIMALQAVDAEDFLARTESILNLQDQADLLAAVRHFAPLYRQTIWEPQATEFQAQQKELQDELNRSRIGQRLAAAKRFYASDWPAERAFWLALVPVPRKAGEKIETYGHSDSFLEVVEVPGAVPMRPRIGVVFHELCHSLWMTRPDPLHQQLRQEFYAQGAAGHYALDQLDEALASALGNGWFQFLSDGPTAPDQASAASNWYMDPIIDKYSHALYSLAKARIESGGTLDKAFAQEAVAQFQRSFPKFLTDVYVMLREIVIISNLQAVHRPEFQNRLSALPFVRTTYATTALSGSDTESALRNHPHAARCYLILPEQRAELERLYGFPRLPARGLMCLQVNDNWHIVAVLADPKDYASLLEHLGKNRYFQSGIINL